jgi:hypothetical protein
MRGTAAPEPNAGANTKGKEKESLGQSQDAFIPKQSRRRKSFNLHTYKFHVLGDYVTSIRRFGTTDSYSTEPVSHSPSQPVSSFNFIREN